MQMIIGQNWLYDNYMISGKRIGIEINPYAIHIKTMRHGEK